MKEALYIHVKGIVQGVGFRPFVFRLAKKHHVCGWVLNAVEGVFIHAEAEPAHMDAFVTELHTQPPAAAVVKEVLLEEVALEGFTNFEIRFSDAHAAEATTLVSPDLATCDDCVAELFDPTNRRYHYPFINCTNCGPRFTIIDSLPYDRPATSMKDFPMCERCAAEYSDPLDRRFHAQPDACFECGPAVSLYVRENKNTKAAGVAEATRAAKATEVTGAAGATEATRVAGAAGAAGATGATGAAEVAKVAGATRTAGAAESAAPDNANTAGSEAAQPPNTWSTRWGKTPEESDAIFTTAAQMLVAGEVLAVKGLGGFHLVCDAANPTALAALRTRKHRPGKAFAVALRNVEAAREFCEVNETEENLLTSQARPIVLLKKRPSARFAEGLADKLPELGVMLPCTPVQHLLLAAFEEALHAAHKGNGPAMLVMTSGNISGNPIVISDEEALQKLGGIASAVLGNNRKILTRYDDSVLRVLHFGPTPESDAIQFVRRARGYAPLPIPLKTAGELQDAPQTETIFATGPEQKNTLAFLRPGKPGEPADVFVSQHLGDVEHAETYDAWLEAKARFEELFRLSPQQIACDKHPEYLTTKWAWNNMACEFPSEPCTLGCGKLPLTEVQHHHAHIASVLGENNLFGPVCGIAFDGTGYGIDKNLWGGEVLLANQETYERFANFAYVPMPGGAACIKHPLRMAYGALWEFDLLEHPAAANALKALGSQAQLCSQMIDKGLNTPMTSSVGRLFDAASALLGVCTEPSYEGQPAIELEAAMGPAPAKDETAYPLDVVKNTATEASTALDTSVVLLDAAPTFKALLDDMAAQVPLPTIAQRFHNAFVQAALMAATLVNQTYGIGTVALSGGVFMNRYLAEHTVAALAQTGFTVALNRDLPPNDGCISYGQCVIAASLNCKAQ